MNVEKCNFIGYISRSLLKTRREFSWVSVHRRQTSAGFTLIEILIAISVLVVITTIVFGALARFNRMHALATSVESSVTLLAEARAFTLASKNASVYGVHFASSSVTRFVGDSYVEGASENDVYVLPASVEITDIALAGGSDVVFDRLTGKTGNSGTITFTLIADDTKTSVVTVDPAGTVSVD